MINTKEELLEIQRYVRKNYDEEEMETFSFEVNDEERNVLESKALQLGTTLEKFLEALMVKKFLDEKKVPEEGL